MADGVAFMIEEGSDRDTIDGQGYNWVVINNQGGPSTPMLDVSANQASFSRSGNQLTLQTTEDIEYEAPSDQTIDRIELYIYYDEDSITTKQMIGEATGLGINLLEEQILRITELTVTVTD